jgi:predicted transcriptional regulator
MRRKIRHQLYLTPAINERFETLAGRPGVTRSAMLEEALVTWLDRRAKSEIDDRFERRLDRMVTALGRIERNDHILLETLALFVRYELSIHAPLAESDQAGRALARERFHAFVEQVGRQIAGGHRTIDVPVSEERR